MTPTKQLPLFLALMVSVVFVFGDTALAEEKRQDPATKVVEGNNEFALDLYKKFAADNKTKNIFFSPYSITQALAMTFEGARAKTALEMGKVLRLPEYVRQVGNDQRPWQTEKFNAILASLNARLTPPKAAETKKFQQKADVLQKKLDDLNTLYQTLLNKREFARARTVHAQARKTAETLNDVYRQFGQYELTLANALWGEQTYPFDKGYLANVNRHFKSGGLRLADFRNNFEAERLRINAWIEKQTRDRIKDILQKGDLNRLTRLVLANAIYFKGQWSEPFDERATKPQDFTLASGTKIKVPTMTDKKAISYAGFNADGSFFETPRTVPLGKNPNKLKNTYPGKDGFAMIELPYRGNELSMVVIAPQDPNGLPALVKNLTATKLDRWVKKMNKRDVKVFLPKFKLETKYQLIKPLKSLGMREAFLPPNPRGGADFSGMVSSKQRDLYISKVIHKAFVEVNEKGTEAAAATVVVLSRTSAPITVPFTPTFKADRPFFFLIRHVDTGSILFIGKVANPKG